MTDFDALLATLADGGVEFILIGGLAAAAHGSIRATRDVDVLYARSAENLARIEAALAPLSPYLRGAPPGLPFRLDAATLRAGLNFTLSTASATSTSWARSPAAELTTTSFPTRAHSRSLAPSASASTSTR